MKRRRSRKASEKSEQQTLQPVKVKTKLIDTEEAATGSVGSGVYFRYFKSIGVWMSISAVLFNLVNQGTSVFSNSKFDNSLHLINLLLNCLFCL